MDYTYTDVTDVYVYVYEYIRAAAYTSIHSWKSASCCALGVALVYNLEGSFIEFSHVRCLCGCFLGSGKSEGQSDLDRWTLKGQFFRLFFFPDASGNS